MYNVDNTVTEGGEMQQNRELKMIDLTSIDFLFFSENGRNPMSPWGSLK